MKLLFFVGLPVIVGGLLGGWIGAIIGLFIGPQMLMDIIWLLDGRSWSTRPSWVTF